MLCLCLHLASVHQLNERSACGRLQQLASGLVVVCCARVGARSAMAAPAACCALSLLLLLLVLGAVAAVDASQDQQGHESRVSAGSPAPAPSPAMSYIIDCGGACAARCALSSRPNLCKRACGSCCARCSCVPPGTAGNHDVCPCYAAITTRGGRRKCP